MSKLASHLQIHSFLSCCCNLMWIACEFSQSGTHFSHVSSTTWMHLKQSQYNGCTFILYLFSCQLSPIQFDCKKGQTSFSFTNWKFELITNETTTDQFIISIFAFGTTSYWWLMFVHTLSGLPHGTFFGRQTLYGSEWRETYCFFFFSVNCAMIYTYDVCQFKRYMDWKHVKDYAANIRVSEVFVPYFNVNNSFPKTTANVSIQPLPTWDHFISVTHLFKPGGKIHWL